jgi:hypothetical protein
MNVESPLSCDPCVFERNKSKGRNYRVSRSVANNVVVTWVNKSVSSEPWIKKAEAHAKRSDAPGVVNNGGRLCSVRGGNCIASNQIKLKNI